MEIHILDDVIAELEKESYSLNAKAIERMIRDNDWGICSRGGVSGLQWVG